MSLLRLSVLGIAVAVIAGRGVAGTPVSDPRLGFQLVIPDGFEPVPEQVQGDILYAFHRPGADDRSVGTLILVKRMGGVIGRDQSDPQKLAAQHPQVTLSTEQWKSFDVEVFRVPEQAGDVRMVTFNAQVPLKPESIQIGVSGDADREAELRPLLRSVLGSLDGETNWLTGPERVSRGIEGAGRLLFFCRGGVVVVVVIVLAIVRGSRKRPKPRRRYRDDDD